MNFRNVMVGTLGCVAISFPLFFAACGDDKSSSTNDDDEIAEDYTFSLEELEEVGIGIYESADEVKKITCGEENEYETAYVKADSSFYVCYKGEWDNDFSSDNYTVEIPIVESEDDLGECNEENEGQMFRVPRDTIFDTYACEDGEWISDFGGNSGELVDPSKVVVGELTDERDGKTYKTVQIGKQTWMAENLNYKTSNSYCYEGKAENCKKYGRLYSVSGVSSACPSGWKVPTLLAWETLKKSMGGSIRVYTDKGDDPYGMNFQYGGIGSTSGGYGGKYYNGLGSTVLYWTGSFFDDIKDPTLRLAQRKFGETVNGLGWKAYIRCIKK